MDTKEKVSTSLDKENDKNKTKRIFITEDENQETELNFFLSKNWEWTGQASKKEDTDFDWDDVDPGHIIKQDKDSEECPHCLCHPCNYCDTICFQTNFTGNIFLIEMLLRVLYFKINGYYQCQSKFSYHHPFSL